jgi:membrane protein DedA with SNARE-associated domain
MITSIIDWLLNIIETLGYPGVFLSMFLESFFAPIPSELILPFAGFVSFNGSLNIYIVIIVATFGAYLGSLPFYILGRLGEKYVYSFINRYGKYLFIYQKDIQRGETLFKKHGNKVVLFGRLIPIIRTVISFPAGVAKMNFLLFSIYTFVGALIWSTILAFLGYLLGDRWEIVGEWISKYEKVVLILIGILLTVFVISRLKGKLFRRNE